MKIRIIMLFPTERKLLTARLLTEGPGDPDG